MKTHPSDLRPPCGRPQEPALSDDRKSLVEGVCPTDLRPHHFAIRNSQSAMLLALDTATQFASIALYDGVSVLAELNWRSERRHTVELAPQVDALFALRNITPQDLTALAVAIGPGSYTGTRIALSFAKGIVAATGLPLVGIPTLDALAYPHIRPDSALCALVAAGRNRYCWASYAPGSGFPERSSAWGLHRLPEILPQLTSPMRFVGELSQDDVHFLHSSGHESIDIITTSLAVRRAGVLAELAWLRLQTGDVDDPTTLGPIYLG